jgi:PAS domain S-box-containing protein
MTPEVEDLKAMWLELRARVDELAGERQHYLDFFEESTEAYVVTDTQGTIVDANGAAVDVLQRRRAQLKGKSLAAMVALDRRMDFRARIQQLMAAERALPGEWSTIFEAPGLRSDVTVRVRPIERSGGVAGLCWLLQAPR